MRSHRKIQNNKTERYIEIDEAIRYMHEKMDEPLPIDKLAKHVSYSPYHFVRIFKHQVGISPHYYVGYVNSPAFRLLFSQCGARNVLFARNLRSLGYARNRLSDPARYAAISFSGTDYCSALCRCSSSICYTSNA